MDDRLSPDSIALPEGAAVKFWATLYDSDDQQIARYEVIGSTPIGTLLITWALNHHAIEYVKITAN